MTSQDWEPHESVGTDILVVDDIEANLIAMEAALSPLNRRVVTASSGTEALARLLESDFALIFLDVQMPTMDGYETARWIRTRPRCRHVPIIFVTAHHRNEEAALKGYRLAAIDFLFKPLSVEILLVKSQVLLALQDQARSRFEALETERRQKRDAEEVLARLVTSERRTREFLVALGDAFRNPLSPIQLAVDVMRSSADAPVPLEILDVIERQVDHLAKLIDDVLDMSRVASNQVELPRQTLALHSVICAAVEEATAAQSPLLVVVRPSHPVSISGDPVRLIQVFATLIDHVARNAGRATRIALDWKITTHHVCVRIAGDIEECEPFCSTDVPLRGFGGLAHDLGRTRKLIELHGGTLGARSSDNQHASAFEVILPLTMERLGIKDVTL